MSTGGGGVKRRARRDARRAEARAGRRRGRGGGAGGAEARAGRRRGAGKRLGPGGAGLGKRGTRGAAWKEARRYSLLGNRPDGALGRSYAARWDIGPVLRGSMRRGGGGR